MSDYQEILDQLDMEYWLERESRPYRMSRGRSGWQLQIRECPNCGNEKWRTYLNAETGVGNCFVCNETFSKKKFIHLALGHDPERRDHWRETFRHIRECVREQGWRPKRETTVAVEYGDIELPTSFALPTPDGQNLVYLEKRGITGDIARFFHLRYCIRGRWNFVREDGRPGWQSFDNRVIIPVFDLDGQLRTFQGRDITGLAGDQKYLFPTGLPGTGRFLYNGQNAHGAKRVCLGEGAFDVMAIKIALDEHVHLRDVVPLGSFGKHLSYGDMNGDDQLGRFIRLQREGLEEVTIMWDGEWAALKSALDAAHLLHGIGLRVRLALLPADTDPNEVDRAVVAEAFEKAVPFTPLLAVKWRLTDPFKRR